MSDVIKNAANGSVELIETATLTALDLLGGASTIATQAAGAPLRVGDNLVQDVIKEAKGLIIKALGLLHDVADKVGDPLP